MSRLSRQKSKREIKKFWFASTALLFLLFAGALWQLNALIHQNSQLTDYRKQLGRISSENGALEIKFSQLNSLENFNQYAIAQAQNYEKVDVISVRYVHAPNEQLARR